MTQSHSIKEERKKKFNILDGSDPILPKPLHRRSLCNLVDLEYFFFLQESGIKLPNQVDPQPKRIESCITSKKCFNTELVKPCAYLGNQVTVSLFSFCFPPKMFFFFFFHLYFEHHIKGGERSDTIYVGVASYITKPAN